MKTTVLEEYVRETDAKWVAARHNEFIKEQALDNNICPNCGEKTTHTTKKMWWRIFSKEDCETKRDFHICSNGHSHTRKHFDYGD